MSNELIDQQKPEAALLARGLARPCQAQEGRTRKIVKGQHVCELLTHRWRVESDSGHDLFLEWFRNPLLYLLAVAFLGARQHALLILMHDGVHYRLFRDKTLNDWMTEALLAWPCLVSARAYRRNHFRHHRYLNTVQDPDWTRKHADPAWDFPKRRGELAWLLLRDLSGLGAIVFLRLLRTVTSEDTAASRGITVSRYGFYLVVGLALYWAGALELFLQYWLVPMFTWLILILRVRSIAEHSAIQGSYDVYAQTRTTYVTLIERIFVAPKNVNYHTRASLLSERAILSALPNSTLCWLQNQAFVTLLI